MDTLTNDYNALETFALIRRAKQAIDECREASAAVWQKLEECRMTFQQADEVLRQARRPHP